MLLGKSCHKFCDGLPLPPLHLQKQAAAGLGLLTVSRAPGLFAPTPIVQKEKLRLRKMGRLPEVIQLRRHKPGILSPAIGFQSLNSKVPFPLPAKPSRDLVSSYPTPLWAAHAGGEALVCGGLTPCCGHREGSPWGSPGHRGVLGGIPVPHPLAARSTPSRGNNK